LYLAIDKIDISDYSLKLNIVVDFSSDLSSDYEKLYESGEYADISIHVGKEPDNKLFLAHTLILCTRNPFFENNLTGRKLKRSP
jgi:hypothetical protein